jgi:hypothetical protein
MQCDSGAIQKRWSDESEVELKQVLIATTKSTPIAPTSLPLSSYRSIAISMYTEIKARTAITIKFSYLLLLLPRSDSSRAHLLELIHSLE